jgi:hypothetical protein
VHLLKHLIPRRSQRTRLNRRRVSARHRHRPGLNNRRSSSVRLLRVKRGAININRRHSIKLANGRRRGARPAAPLARRASLDAQDLAQDADERKVCVVHHVRDVAEAGEGLDELLELVVGGVALEHGERGRRGYHGAGGGLVVADQGDGRGCGGGGVEGHGGDGAEEVDAEDGLGGDVGE